MKSFANIEHKRQQYLKKLTLGQRMGLFEKPPEPLAQQDWHAVEQKNLKRNEKECPICCESLQFHEQTILSCSHVFHKTCLHSFEKFMKNKGAEKHCPICRTTCYDSKPFVEGQRRYLVNSCIRIQSVARGFL